MQLIYNAISCVQAFLSVTNETIIMCQMRHTGLRVWDSWDVGVWFYRRKKAMFLGGGHRLVEFLELVLEITFRG